MELWEKGIINKKDTGGLDFSWGNKKTMIEMIHKIAKREGFGNTLADGVRIAAEKIGKGAQKYAMHVKGLEISAQDGRAQKSMGIAHATSVRGADHLRHCSFYDEIGFPHVIEERFGKQYIPEMANRLSTKYKGILAKECEDFAAIVNSLIMCTGGGTFWPPVVWWNEIANVCTTVTGNKTTATELKTIADRIINLKRAYNQRLGLTRKQDILPKRFLEEKAPDGPCKGHVVDLKTMLDEYFKERGWDPKTGLIPSKKLKKLGLKSVADQLDLIRIRESPKRKNKKAKSGV
jgi:aldehyde:ferredoxin oxidoreductase